MLPANICRIPVEDGSDKSPSLQRNGQPQEVVSTECRVEAKDNLQSVHWSSSKDSSLVTGC